MIYDLLHSPTRLWLDRRHAVLRTSFEWLEAMPADQPDGITELDGRDFYVNVHRYATKPVENCRWESHRITVDLQCCITGGELIEWAPASRLELLRDYDESKEVEHWRGDDLPCTSLRMVPGSFVLFAPNELHRPQLADGANVEVRKLVFKIRAGLLDL